MKDIKCTPIKEMNINGMKILVYYILKMGVREEGLEYLNSPYFDYYASYLGFEKSMFEKELTKHKIKKSIYQKKILTEKKIQFKKNLEEATSTKEVNYWKLKIDEIDEELADYNISEKKERHNKMKGQIYPQRQKRLEIIKNKSVFNIKELADELKVDVKVINKDLVLLRELGTDFEYDYKAKIFTKK